MPTFTTTRRGILGLIGGLAIFRSAPAVAVPDTFTLVPQLAVGQTLRYRLDQRTERNGALVQRAASRVSIAVVEALDAGWLARWTVQDTQLLDADPRMRPLLEALQHLWDGVPIDVVLDEAGRVAGVADMPGLRERMRESMDRLLAVVAKDPAMAPLDAHLRAALQPMLANEAYIAQAVLKEPGILLGAMGREYRVGEPLEVRTTVASPLGTGEIPILGRFDLRGVNGRGQLARLGWLMVVDRHTTARVVGGELQPSVDRLAGAAAVDATAALAGMDFDDRGDFDVDTATAWPTRVSHTRRIAGGDSSRTDSVEFSRLG
ncbi:hypothetical protein [Piscinibacter sp. HJYY11]|uniref:hypothetical protein n=1 Tax=Piscinibacter sp. HJYY11 TaxID=2801333 RepID=UPI00191D9696|nr:hypothetical protein [Piscinibacter sp. HJYY11]MBL0729023.1 hypothetical protein [Piscinibacter sp. HJYY11]